MGHLFALRMAPKRETFVKSGGPGETWLTGGTGSVSFISEKLWTSSGEALAKLWRGSEELCPASPGQQDCTHIWGPVALWNVSVSVFWCLCLSILFSMSVCYLNCHPCTSSGEALERLWKGSREALERLWKASGEAQKRLWMERL